MSLLVVGSVARDTIRTPHGEIQDALGGAAVYFSLAACNFTEVRLVGVVGDDFGDGDIELLRSREIDLAGLEIVEGGKTFRWSGEYSEDMNSRETLSVELNVFEHFEPVLPPGYTSSSFVFLANASPATQLSVLEQVESPVCVMADTMDLWIDIARDGLVELLGRIDGISLNDSEALQLTGCRNLIDAGQAILDMGPANVIVKKGEHGAVLFTAAGVVALPAYPTGRVVDPTGAGDSFAGALMGSLARDGAVDEERLKAAIAYGSVVASFTCEGFGTVRLAEIGADEINDRFLKYCESLQISR
jgi:sugar/nucleoside kinase (ribokinase family)